MTDEERRGVTELVGKLNIKEDEIVELRKELIKKAEINHFIVSQLADLESELAEAKDLIRNLLRVTYGEGWNYSLDWKVKAEEFLKEEI